MRLCIRSRYSKFGAVGLGLLITGGSPPSFGQSADLQTQFTIKVGSAAHEITDKWNSVKDRPEASPESIVRQVLEPHQKISLYALVLALASAGRTINAFKTDVDEARVDKQLGSSSHTAGSTSLTSKGSVPAILGFAVENGSLGRSISGTTITFTGRPVQIVQSLQNTSFTQSYKKIENNVSLGILNRFSFSFSFDTSRGNQTGTFTGNANQFSAFTLHVDVINHRDPRNKKYDGRWQTLQTGVAQQLAGSLYNVYDQIISVPAFQIKFKKWLDDTALAISDKLQSSDDQGVVDNLQKQLQAFPTPDDIPGADTLLKNFANSTDAMLKARNDILSFVGKAPILTFEYSDNRAALAAASQLQLPDTSSFTLVGEFTPFKGGSFTLNAVADIFSSKPKGVIANVLRDLSASAQLDIPVNVSSVSKIGNVVLSLSAKYERIPQNAIPVPSSGSIVTTSDAVLRGDMAIGQAKLTIPVKGSGVKIPISFSVANRTELIKEKDVRGNIGITFDLDTIIGKLKP